MTTKQVNEIYTGVFLDELQAARNKRLLDNGYGYVNSYLQKPNRLFEDGYLKSIKELMEQATSQQLQKITYILATD